LTSDWVPKKMVQWLASKPDGASVDAIVRHTKLQICEGKITEKAVEKLIEELDHDGVIEYVHPRWKITRSGRAQAQGGSA